MLIIQNYLISDDILREEFVCNLSKCKGACCWLGDFGAPIYEDEIDAIDETLSILLPLLPKESQNKISTSGFATFYKEKSFTGTSLIENGACVFLIKDETGCATCCIEHAHDQGLIKFNKPISCHLYPIRIHSDPFTGIEMLIYDRWDICNEACKLGKELKMPVYQFLKNALIRRFGTAFYEELDAAARHLKSQQTL